MWATIKAWLGMRAFGKEAPASVDTSAKARLQALREAELSVGAEMRRGVRVARAPGQLVGGASAAPPQSHRHLQVVNAPVGPERRPSWSNQEFGVSEAIGAATGSAIAGYVVGGSIAGGLVGESLIGLSHEPPRPPAD